MVKSIETEIIDPSITYILVSTSVLYDNKKPHKLMILNQHVKTSIINYNETNLNKFDSNFSLSKLSKQ